MDDRGQVRVITSEGDIYLYTQWGATELVDDVRRALARRVRWDDEEYLTRMIFCEMIRGSGDPLDGETGYGIGLVCHGDVRRVVEVHTTNRTVVVRDNNESTGSVSFDACVENGVLLLAELGGDSG